MNPVSTASSSLRAPLLVVGAKGMLGRAVLEACLERGLAVRPVDIEEIDIVDEGSVARVVGEEFGCVVNCAAYTDVDGAESNESAAMSINAHGAGNLARRCAATGAAFLHVSTDYVFDGAGSRPYPTTEPRRPLSAYGRTKAAGEEQVERSGADHLIVRTSWLYAPWGKNFVRTIAGLARSRDELRVVDDQRGRPTSAEGLARSILALLDAGARGVRHATDGGECTWFELAGHIVSRIGAPCRVLPCTTAEHPRPARRPAYSVLDLSETERSIGPMKPWKDAVSGVIARMETP